ncbi:MAG TPA: hypothetical protein VKY31_08650, partial [Terriglobia bacterium]|nr:hypothetical protein [Terriglobia bacterium]
PHDAAERAKASFEIPLPEGGAQVTISPDGRNLAIVRREGKTNRVWLRPIASLEGTFLKGTDGAQLPFWSPDSHYIAYFDARDEKLKKVDVSGGPPQVICDAPRRFGGTWNKDGVILFGMGGGVISSVASKGGMPAPVTELDKTRNETAHGWPYFLPDGDHFLFLAFSSNPDQTGIRIGSLKSKKVKPLIATNIGPVFARPDYLLFVNQSALMAQKLDAEREELVGEPVRVADNVGSLLLTGYPLIGVSENGVLAYRRGEAAEHDLVWMGRDGQAQNVIAKGEFNFPRVSPDGTKIAVSEAAGPARNIFIIDLQRGTKSRLTFLSKGTDNFPVWSPDGKTVTFSSDRDGQVFNIYKKDVTENGNDELLLKTPNYKRVTDWSSDGRYVLYQEQHPNNQGDVWVLPTFGERKPIQLLGSSFNERSAGFSPDAHWFVYESDESGTNQVYVQPFPPNGKKWIVSPGVGTGPRWSRDGKELYFDDGGMLVAVDVTTTPDEQFRSGSPHRLFESGQVGLGNYDVVPGKDRFLVNEVGEVARSVSIEVILNWFEGLKR